MQLVLENFSSNRHDVSCCQGDFEDREWQLHRLDVEYIPVPNDGPSAHTSGNEVGLGKTARGGELQPNRI